MRKVIASLVEGKNYEIALNATRAPYFIIFEDDKYLRNQYNFST